MNKENLLKELEKEILNKEFTLLDLDNTIENLTESTTSVFDFDLERDIMYNDKEGFCSYYITEEIINLEFEVIEDNNDEREILVKVTNVSWL